MEFSKTYYLIYKNGKKEITINKSDNISLAEIQPAELLVKEKNVNKEDIYFVQRFSDVGNGLFKRSIKFVNYSNETFNAKIVLKVKTGFCFNNWIIPAVMYNGNEFGKGDSPKGILKNGKPWVFSYDRCSIASCTLSENKNHVFAMFASDTTASSLVSSCSFEADKSGKGIHKLIYPVSEEPVSYVGKNTYSDPYEGYITFYPGSAFEAESYIYISEPEYENYGYINLLKTAVDIFKNDYLPSMDNKVLEEVSLDYIKRPLEEYGDREKIQFFSRDYTHPLGNNIKDGEWDKYTLKMIEEKPQLNKLMIILSGATMGFASQAFMQCRMLIKYAIKNDDLDTVNFVMDYLDRWTANQKDNGLVTTSFPGISSGADVTELGWGASEAVKIYLLLTENNIDGKKYLEFSKRICSFFVDNYSDEKIFGQRWDFDGNCITYGGCSGSFLIKAMLELYSVCKEEKYLNCAKKALDKYFRKDMNKFVCSAGAIDCNSVDKESSFPFLYSSMEIYRQTGDEKYIEYARKSAAYFLSWMFCYDAVYDKKCDFSDLGYHTAGGTVVSAEHQCIDPYAAVIVPDLIDLYELTHEDLWKKAGDLIWRNCMQCVAGKNGWDFHSMHRLPGMQNECFAQTRWTKYRSSPELKGHLNDFMGIWLPLFKLYSIDRLENTDFFKNE